MKEQTVLRACPFTLSFPYLRPFLGRWVCELPYLREWTQAIEPVRASATAKATSA